MHSLRITQRENVCLLHIDTSLATMYSGLLHPPPCKSVGCHTMKSVGVEGCRRGCTCLFMWTVEGVLGTVQEGLESIPKGEGGAFRPSD